MKNIMHALIGGLIWWAWGFAIGFGNVDGGFFGTEYFFGKNLIRDSMNA